MTYTPFVKGSQHTNLQRKIIICDTVTNTTAARGHKTYMCATENPELCIFYNGKQTNPKTCLEIYDCVVFFVFCCCSCSFEGGGGLYAENLGGQNSSEFLSISPRAGRSRCFASLSNHAGDKQADN